MPTGAASCALLLLTAAGQTSPALDAVRAVVVPLGEAARTEALYGGLSAAGARIVSETARRGIDRPTDPAAQRHVPLDQPRAALLSAKAAMRALDLETVDAELATALERLLRTERPAQHRDLLADILLLRAEVALARGRAAEAERDLVLLARTDPTREALHPGLHPPRLIEAFARAREAGAAAASGFLAVLPDAAHPDATVTVNGEAHALTDGRVSLELPAGPHLVSVSAPGRVGFADVVELAPGAPLFLEVFLPPPDADDARAAAVARLREDRDDGEALATLCALTGANAVLLVEDEALWAWSEARGLTPVSAAPDDDPLTIGSAFLAALRPPATTTSDAPVVAIAEDPPAAEGDGDEEDLSGALWLGAAVVLGVGLVGAATGVTVFVIASSQPKPDPPRPVGITCCSPGG